MIKRIHCRDNQFMAEKFSTDLFMLDLEAGGMSLTNQLGNPDLMYLLNDEFDGFDRIVYLSPDMVLTGYDCKNGEFERSVVDLDFFDWFLKR